MFWPVQLGGNTQFIIVQGQSMLPTILPGSMVVIKEASSYHIDDIVAWEQRSGRLSHIVVHRIIDKTDQGFVIKGDNNQNKDAGFPTSDDILGKVIFATPYVGDMLAMLRNPIVLIMTAGVLAVIQMEQEKRKKRKERLRRIRLGLPLNEVAKNTKKPPRPKKPNYSLFFVALGLNVIVYFVLQYSVASGITPKGDMITGFLFNIFVPSFAATLSFALYFLFIFGLYFVAKYYQAKSYRASHQLQQGSNTAQLLVTKKSNRVLGIASFLWLLYVFLSIFHLFAIGRDFLSVVF